MTTFLKGVIILWKKWWGEDAFFTKEWETSYVFFQSCAGRMGPVGSA